MSAVDTPAGHLMSLPAFVSYAASVEHKTELVEGIAVMVPWERPENRYVVTRLIIAVERCLGGREVVAFSDLTLVLDSSARPTVRVPDAVVCRLADVPREIGEGDVADFVELAVEVVSPSSRADDYLHKNRQYARSGIPAYLVVDPDERRLTLFHDPGDSGYTRLTEGESLALIVDGVEVRLHIDDLLM